MRRDRFKSKKVAKCQSKQEEEKETKEERRAEMKMNYEEWRAARKLKW